MSEPCPAEFIAFAHRLGDIAADILRERASLPPVVEIKGDGSPVTDTDKAVETAVVVISAVNGIEPMAVRMMAQAAERGLEVRATLQVDLRPVECEDSLAAPAMRVGSFLESGRGNLVEHVLQQVRSDLVPCRAE